MSKNTNLYQALTLLERLRVFQEANVVPFNFHAYDEWATTRGLLTEQHIDEMLNLRGATKAPESFTRI
jgi:hypothetical protein